MQHKWHKEIKAWADGAEIEYQREGWDKDEWYMDDDPQWNDPQHEFRIKPQPKEKKYLYAYYRDKVYFLQDKDASNRYYIGKIEVM
jgi:hypothetical protein